MASTRGALRRIGLVLSGLLVVALMVGVGLAATFAGSPQPVVTAPTPISVGAGASVWTCAPAPTLMTAAAGEDVEYDPDLGTGGGAVATLAEVTAISTDETATMIVGPIGEEASSASTAGTLATFTQSEITDPMVAVANPLEDGVPLVAGVSVARADAGDLRGLSAAACQQPISSAMLVGGSTQLGASARLVLTNPGETTASVSITGWGATGPLPDIAPLVVPAGGVRTLLLETVSLDERIAIRIDVVGGRVVPSIQDTSLNGLIAAGTEMIGVTANPADEVTIPAVAISTDEGAGALLRVVNPGVEPAQVTVEMLGPDGATVLPGAEASVIEAGTVADISLAGVAAGEYAVRITSSEPVTGAVRMSRTGTAGADDPDTPPVDIAWMPATAPVQLGALQLPSDLVDQVTVTATNPGTAGVDVTVRTWTVTGEAAEPTTVTVPAGATTQVPVPAGATAVVLEGDGILGSVIATADAADGTLIAAYPITADPYTEQSVTVRVSG